MLTPMEIGGLRTLLPDKLINPTRFALDNPGGYEPEKLATYLQKAAQAGSRDVQKFKKDWHSDEVRELWQSVGTHDVVQGGDAWSYDYVSLSQDVRSNEHISEAATGASHQLQPKAEEDVAKVVETFRSRHPELMIQAADATKTLPLKIRLAQLDFRITMDDSHPSKAFVLLGEPESESSPLREEILQSIRKTVQNPSLTSLLVCINPQYDCPFDFNFEQENLAAFHDIKSRPCDKCKKPFNSNFKLPLIRQQTLAVEGQQPRFLALHRDCV